jgi:hypothetical protein
MEKQGQGEKAGRTSEGRVVRQPVTAQERAEIVTNKPKRGCWCCIFRVSDLMMWAQTLLSGFPIAGLCANHPNTPGRLRPVPGPACRNFKAKPRVEGTPAPVPPDANSRYIPLTRNLHALVDAQDYEMLKDYKWHATYARAGGTMYACRREGKHTVRMHRQIMNPPKGKGSNR